MQHGHAAAGRSPEYEAWQNMCQRCTNEKFRQQKDYSGRGIKVFPDWLGPGGFALFLKEVGRRPSSEYTLDRKDNDRGYEPGNVRWATRVEQNNNTSKNVFLTVRNEKKTIAQWCAVTGLKHSTLRARLQAGWSSEQAVLTAVRVYHRS
jgi:hypothetical protein